MAVVMDAGIPARRAWYRMVRRANGAVADFETAPATPPAASSFTVSMASLAPKLLRGRLLALGSGPEPPPLLCPETPAAAVAVPAAAAAPAAPKAAALEAAPARPDTDACLSSDTRPLGAGAGKDPHLGAEGDGAAGMLTSPRGLPATRKLARSSAGPVDSRR